MHEKERRVIEYPPGMGPWLSPQELAAERASQRSLAQAASREESERLMAEARAMNPPPMPIAEPPPLRKPVLPDNFDRQAMDLDEQIYERGIAFSRDRLLALGKERFEELLARDHEARSLQRVIFGDLTTWPTVMYSFASAGALGTGIPPRKMMEQHTGAGLDREAAASITDWDDLWKARPEPETVRRIYDFHDAFVRLIFGQSLLERLSKDGRVRSRFFCGGQKQTEYFFQHWLSTLEGPHFKVVIARPLWSIVAWLAQQRIPLIAPAELTHDWLGKRSPSTAEVRRVEAVVEGWLLGYTGWSLWDFVGTRTRRAVDVSVLEMWRADLARRHPAVTRFHEDLRGFFWTSPGGDGYRRFNEKRYRAYLSAELHKFLAVVLVLAAQAVGSACIARFTDGWLLCQGKPRRTLRESIEYKLASAFPGSRFNISVEEVV
jgi:hypothetical protein